MRLLMAGLAICVLAAGAVSAQEQDVDGSKDHPMFTRMPGYYIDQYEEQDFAPYEFFTSPSTNVEGKFWKIDYNLKEGAKKAGPLQISRNYTNLITARGGKKLVEDVDANGGHAIVVLPVEGKKIWVAIDIYDTGESYELTVVEEAGMKQDVEFTAMELATALKEKGTVTLHNILFVTGKASLQPESTTALAPVGQMLQGDASLKLEIRGHTDTVGTPAANLKLSEERAAAVKAHLVQEFGIDPARLTTAGLGDTEPIASNKTDEGRAQNRRVELVKK